MASKKTPGVKTLYTVMEAGWEYNDNYYFTPENEGGKPVKLFRDKKNAKKLALTLTREFFLEHGSLSSFGNSLERVLEDNWYESLFSEEEKACMQVFEMVPPNLYGNHIEPNNDSPKFDENVYKKFFQEISDEALAKFLTVTKFSAPFTIEEVEVE